MADVLKKAKFHNGFLVEVKHLTEIIQNNNKNNDYYYCIHFISLWVWECVYTYIFLLNQDTSWCAKQFISTHFFVSD